MVSKVIEENAKNTLYDMQHRAHAQTYGYLLKRHEYAYMRHQTNKQTTLCSNTPKELTCFIAYADKHEFVYLCVFLLQMKLSKCVFAEISYIHFCLYSWV